MTFLSYAEKRGTIDYFVGTEVRTFEGWLHLDPRDGRTIVARKIRGRNHWRLTDVEHALTFRPKEAGR